MSSRQPEQEGRKTKEGKPALLPAVSSTTSSHGSSLLGEALMHSSSAQDINALEEQRDTRPPLPPPSDESPSTQRFDQQPAVGHNREQSTGDDSCLSGITEGTPSPIQTQYVSHGVPWNNNKVPSVEDIHKASPLESEAETAILKAVEQRGGGDPSKAASHLFAEIPPHALESFRAASSQKTAERRTDEQTPKSSPRPSPRGHGDHHRAKKEGTRHTRNVSREQGTHHTRSVPREQNLEAQLVGLTAAMRLMHNKSDDAAETKDQRSWDNLPQEYLMHDHHRRASQDDPGSSLAKNASVLYRRKNLRNQKRQAAFRDLRKESHVREHGRHDMGVVEEAAEESNTSSGAAGIRTDSVRDETKGSGQSIDIEYGENDSDGSKGSKSSHHKFRAGNVMRREKKKFVKGIDHMSEDWTYFSEFVRPRRARIRRKLISVVFFILLPLIGTASLLFYVPAFDNPIIGAGASTSWFLIFLSRHAIAFSLSHLTQIFLIDYLTLRTFSTVRILGPFWSLCLVQSKGFPFIMASWALYAFTLLSGGNRFAKHWLFYQDAIEVFNDNNPAGTITESSANYTILASALVFGVAVTIKRVYLGFKFGKRAYRNYGEELANVIQQVLLVAEVAGLAMDLERGKDDDEIRKRASILNYNVRSSDGELPSYDIDSDTATASGAHDSMAQVGDRRDRYTGSFSQSQKNEFMDLLESWEEPETEKQRTEEISMNTILEFRQALTLTANDYPFSVLFGPANTREACIESSQKVYNSLLLNQPEGEQMLKFDTIALLATTRDGDIDREKMKDLIRLFRPDRAGNLSQLDFIKSVDAVYKRLRLLSASIANSGQVDKATEEIFNWAFYIIFFVIWIIVLGYDPMALFVTLSSIIVAFAFAIGSASAKYFEGLLFILARKPYDIGDRIHVSPVDEDTSPNGSNTWFVEKVSLFATTIRYAMTNEVATVSNGSLANSRIINAARSPKMLVYVYMKFGVDVPYHKVQVFRETVENFVKRRPRDWLSMSGFRATRVEHELGFIEYVICLQHRERWQNIAPMLNAKAEFSSFANEVAKKLDMPYRAPPLPVDLNLASRDAVVNRERDQVSADVNLAEMRQSEQQAAGRSPPPDMSDLKALFS